jgi:hypothetical protein
MAIHDAHYATPPPDWPSLLYRLQYLAEMGVGRRVRQAQAQEDAAFAAAAAQVE